jgi:hypothetical protein
LRGEEEGVWGRGGRGGIEKRVLNKKNGFKDSNREEAEQEDKEGKTATARHTCPISSVIRLACSILFLDFIMRTMAASTAYLNKVLR